MIIRRYLSTQIASTTAVLVLLLVLIAMGGRLVRYLGLAVDGRLDVTVLLELIAFRMPDFLVLILPLSVFLALMLTFGRLYVDHEMAVFNASGISRPQLGVQLLPLVLALAVLEAALALWVGPWSNRETDRLFAEQAARSGFDLVQTGTFVSSGAYTLYAESQGDQKAELKHVFFYQRASEPGAADRMIVAERARRVMDPEKKASIVDLTNGRQYLLRPGSPEYSHAEFAYYRLRLAHEPDSPQSEKHYEKMPLAQLWRQRTEAPAQAELGWRLSIALTLPLALLLALPLSEVSPRQGRWLRLFPAVLVFASLVVLLVGLKPQVAKGKWPAEAPALVLLAYATLGLFWSRRPQLAARIRSLRS